VLILLRGRDPFQDSKDIVLTVERHRIVSGGLQVLLASLLCLCQSAYAAHDPEACTPKFFLQQGTAQGWLGADVASSIPLQDGRDVWVFGDTLYGTDRVAQNGKPSMIRNSIGISTCNADGRWNLIYQIRTDSAGHPQDFFTAQHPHTWYWALDGFAVGDALWITLLCVRNAPHATSQAMGFETCGSDLARVSVAGPDPQKWEITYFPLVGDGAHAYPSATAVVYEDYAYVFALQEAGGRPLLVTRIPLTGLENPAKHLQYLSDTGAWQSGFDPQHAEHVMEQGSSELSIRYHAEEKQWVAVMFAPEVFSRKILLRTASTLTGPWTLGQVIYDVPEMRPDNPQYDKDIFCYAAKEHPEFERGDLVFSYVCNTFAVARFGTNHGIYFPRLVRMPHPW